MVPRGKYFSLTIFTNVDWQGDDLKRTRGGAFFIGEFLVSWFSKKQVSIYVSTIEVEYIAPDCCCSQLLWMNQGLQDVQVLYDQPIPIICDNTCCIIFL